MSDNEATIAAGPGHPVPRPRDRGASAHQLFDNGVQPTKQKRKSKSGQKSQRETELAVTKAEIMSLVRDELKAEIIAELKPDLTAQIRLDLQAEHKKQIEEAIENLRKEKEVQVALQCFTDLINTDDFRAGAGKCVNERGEFDFDRFVREVNTGAATGLGSLVKLWMDKYELEPKDLEAIWNVWKHPTVQPPNNAPSLIRRPQSQPQPATRGLTNGTGGNAGWDWGKWGTVGGLALLGVAGTILATAVFCNPAAVLGVCAAGALVCSVKVLGIGVGAICTTAAVAAARFMKNSPSATPKTKEA